MSARVGTRREPKTRLLGLVAGQRERKVLCRCVYCGAVCQGKACRIHRDLVQIDPGMGSLPS